MFKMKHAMWAILPFAVACGDDGDSGNGGDPGPGNIVEVAQEAGGFDTLLQTATDLGLAPTLTGDGPLTVFAPNDAAFSALGDLSPVSNDVLTNIILAHVAAGELSAADITSAGTVTTVANISHTFDAGALTLRGAAIDTTDVDASNGIIHIMSDVIIPPTILEAAGELGFSELANAVGSASSATQGALAPDTLAGDMPITVFAPTNEAFGSADLSAENLDDVLGYHVVMGQVLSSDLSDGQVVTTVQGSELTVNIDGSSVTLTDARGNVINVVTPDVRTLTGVIHAIDGVLLPGEPGPGNIVEVAQEAGIFSTLLTVATDLGLADVLTGAGPLTVFAPTDTAFSALNVDFEPVSSAVLENIILAHVASGELDAATLTGEGSVDTAANISHVFDASVTPPTVRDADIETADVDASNGIIHIMGEVIVPPTIIGLVGELGFTGLAGAVGAASEAIGEALNPDTLGGDMPITVFAPNNEAFDAVDLDGADVDAILSYHVVMGQVLSTDLEDEQVITTVHGDTLTVGKTESGVTLTDARGNVVNVTTADVRTLSGVVHVVDAVLQPQGNIVQVATDAGNFETLLAVATDLGLADTLAGPGPLTVFAPTDDAFSALNVDFTPVSADVLENIILAHVASGELDAAALTAEGSVGTLANISHEFDASMNPPTVRGAAIGSADVDASNGIIHIMDAVIVPPTILAAAGELGFSELAGAVGGASPAIGEALDPDTLTGDDPITVFAPTNAAFQAANLGSENVDDVLSYHVVAGQVLSTDLPDGQPQVVPTVNGANLTIVRNGTQVMLTDGRGNNFMVETADVRTLSGVIHAINGVLLPPAVP